MSDFTARIDSLLNERKLKRSDLCRATGISESSVRSWIKQNSVPNAEYAIKVAKFFGVSVEWLINGGNDDAGEKLVLAPEEMELVEIFRRLTQEQKAFILDNVNFLLKQRGEAQGSDDVRV